MASIHNDGSVVPEPVAVDNLLLDRQNPRLASSQEATSQPDILATLYDEMALDEIALSISENGYFMHEHLFAIPAEQEKQGPKGKWVVIEGNRRLAAVMLLLDDKARKQLNAEDLPKLNANQKAGLTHLPVIKCPDRKSLWQFLGFRHINGVKPWDPYSKAQYVAHVHEDLGVPLDEIAKKIGDRHSTVRRLYRGYLVLRFAESKGFSREDRVKRRFSFSHLYTAIEYPEIQNFLGIHGGNLNPKVPIAKSHIEDLKDLLTWLYGSSQRGMDPVIKTQHKDLVSLAEILAKPRAIAALRNGNSLAVSHQISIGDQRRFERAVYSTTESLKIALGLVKTGFNRKDQPVRQAIREAAELAEELANSTLQTRTTKSS